MLRLCLIFGQPGTPVSVMAGVLHGAYLLPLLLLVVIPPPRLRRVSHLRRRVATFLVRPVLSMTVVVRFPRPMPLLSKPHQWIWVVVRLFRPWVRMPPPPSFGARLPPAGRNRTLGGVRLRPVPRLFPLPTLILLIDVSLPHPVPEGRTTCEEQIVHRPYTVGMFRVGLFRPLELVRPRPVLLRSSLLTIHPRRAPEKIEQLRGVRVEVWVVLVRVVLPK